MFINFARIKAYAVDKIKLIGYIYVCVAVLSVAGADCHAMMQREQTLDEAAILMYEMPDSAMLVVEKTEPRLAAVLSADKTEADSVANAVFNYYRKHGSRREKFDMYYIIGRLHQLRGNEESAMFCYISADEHSGEVPAPALRGCLYASMASLFEYGFDYRKAEKYYRKAGDSFLEAGQYRYYTEAGIMAARCCFYCGDEAEAEKILDGMEPYKKYADVSDKVRYFRLILNMRHDIPLEDVLKVVRSFGEVDEPSNMLAISDIYLKSGFPDSAITYLKRYEAAYPDYTSSPVYYLRLSNVYDTLGQDRKALDAYRKHIALKDSTYMDKIGENVQLVAAMYDSYVQMSRSERVKRYLWYSLAAVLAVGILTVLHFRRKIWKQAGRAAYLEELYRNVSQERDALTEMRRNSVLIDEPVRNVLENRLAVLDELLTMRRLGNSSPAKAMEMIESIALDQDAYLNSLGLMFSMRHPALSDYLRSRQFSTWEIGYCSLYFMGYKGKDIGNILSSSRYYKINSAIRKKLGLGPTETNLDIYLKNLSSGIESSGDRQPAGSE